MQANGTKTNTSEESMHGHLRAVAGLPALFRSPLQAQGFSACALWPRVNVPAGEGTQECGSSLAVIDGLFTFFAPADPVFTRRHPDVHAKQRVAEAARKRSLLSAEGESPSEVDSNRFIFILSNSEIPPEALAK